MLYDIIKLMVGINSNLTSSLLGSSSTKLAPNVSDVLTGKSSGQQGLTAALASSLGLSSSSNISDRQSESFSGLEKFISDNVSDDAVKANLLKDLSAIKNILETGDVSANQDPVFSLISGLSGASDASVTSGLLVDSVI